MSERTQLLKKAVLTGVGASTSPERIKQALAEALEDLYKVGKDLLGDFDKVGKDLLGDLEVEGEVKTEKVQNLLKNIQTETTKHKSNIEQNFQTSLKKTARDLGFVTREDLEEVLERISALEESNCEDNDGENVESKKPRSSKAKRSS